MKEYSVVVVARDHARHLLGALLALRQRAQPSEVLLVDNASSSRLDKLGVLSQLPVRYLPLSQHHSLGAAFNVGLDAARHDFVLLLHSDVFVETDPIVAVDYLIEHPEVGIIGGKLLREGANPRRVRHAGYAVGRGRVGCTTIGRGEWDRFRDPVDVDAVSDACLLLRRTELRFDERYWFCLEDVDLCHQYGSQGYCIVLLPALRAVHFENAGVQEHRREVAWSVRQLATHLLHHERWCSDATLKEHPVQTPARGSSALEYLRTVDAEFASRSCGSALEKSR